MRPSSLTKLSWLLPVLLLASCGVSFTSKEKYVERGNAFVQKRQFPDAILNYKNAIQKDPGYAEAYFRLGLLTIQEGQIPDAIALLEKALQLKPDHQECRLALAKLYLDGLTALQKPPQAYYEKLQRIAGDYLKADANSFEGNRLMGRLSLLDSKPTEAVNHFQIARKAKPDSVEVATLLVQSLLAAGKETEAETVAQATLRALPAAGPVYDILYLHYMTSRRHADGESLLRQRIAATPKDVLPVVQLAGHYHGLKQLALRDQTLARLTQDSGYENGSLAAADFSRDHGDTPRAIALYEKGASSPPPMGNVFRKRLAELYIRTNQTTEAAALLEAVVKADPQDREAIASRAALRAASGQPAEIDVAIKEFQALVAAEPQSVSYHLALARALRLRGKVEDARRHLLKSLEINPVYLPALEESASLALQLRRVPDIQSYASRALALDPSLPSMRLAYSAALALSGKNVEARQEINSLIREFPSLREAHLQLALLNIEEKKFQEAETIYRKHYRPGQNDPRIIRGLVELSFASGQPDQALRALQEEIKSQPQSAELHRMLATTAARMNRTALALEHFEWLKQNTPPASSTDLGIGLVHQQSGNWPAAIKHFQAARELAPKDPAVLASLAYALQQSGQPGQAVPVYREALDLAPDYLIARNNLAVALTESGGDLSEALRLAHSAVSKAPSNAMFVDALGLVYLKRNETSNAIQSFRSAVAKDPNSILYRIHLARALAQSGNKDAARLELASASARKPSPEEQKEIQEISNSIR